MDGISCENAIWQDDPPSLARPYDDIRHPDALEDAAGAVHGDAVSDFEILFDVP